MPGKDSRKRYPKGDGCDIYPGKPIDADKPVESIRIKQVRERAEDYKYLSLPDHLIKNTDPSSDKLISAKKRKTRPWIP